MAEAPDSKAPEFQYQPLDRTTGHPEIRLFTILPLQPGEPSTTPLRGMLAHVRICACQLSPGETEESLASRFPSIYFSTHVTNRPKECYPAPRLLALAEEGAGGWKARFARQKLFQASPNQSSGSDELDPSAARELYIESLANLVGHPEETGGGFSMSWPVDASMDDSGGGRIAKGFRRLRNRLGRLRPAPRPVYPPERKYPPLRRKFLFGNYVALSYACGEGISPHKISIQNWWYGNREHADEEFGELSIGVNLDAALRRLRTMPYFAGGGPVWVDALCINQADRVEKDWQISRMSEIYQSAGNIIVWLGHGSAANDKAIDHIQDIGKWFRAEWQEAYDESDVYRAHQHREAVAVHFRLALEMWKTAAKQSGATFWEDHENQLVVDFFNLPYFRRLWTIQEMAMGTADMTFVLGDRVTEWRYIRDAAFLYAAISDVLAQSLPSIPEPHASVCHVAKIAQLEIRGHRKRLPALPVGGIEFSNRLQSGPADGPVKGSALWLAFQMISEARCTVPADRIFGILSLPGLPDLGIVPDSLQSTVQVFQGFAAACIGKSYRQPLEYLCLVDGATDSVDGERLPSWVPNFASERRTGIIQGGFRAGDKWTRYQLMGFEDFGAAPEVSISDGVLHCKGFLVDTVDGLGGIAPSDPDATNPKFRPGVFQCSQHHPWSLETPPEASIWHAFVAGTDENGISAPKSYADLLGAFVDCYNCSEVEKDTTAWDFVAASASLAINGKPMGAYLKYWDFMTNYDLDVDMRMRGPEAWVRTWQATGSARQTMASRVRRKRLMITGKGMLGLVPNSVVVGDVIIIIKGHGRPVIATQTQAGDNLVYRLKGEAFVDGMMAGEMMEEEHAKPLEFLAFV